jgi:hypothetical protein
MEGWERRRPRAPELTDDVIEHLVQRVQLIFSHDDALMTLIKASTLSHQWRAACIQEGLWHRMCLARWPEGVPELRPEVSPIPPIHSHRNFYATRHAMEAGRTPPERGVRVLRERAYEYRDRGARWRSDLIMLLRAIDRDTGRFICWTGWLHDSHISEGDSFELRMPSAFMANLAPWVACADLEVLMWSAHSQKICRFVDPRETAPSITAPADADYVVIEAPVMMHTEDGSAFVEMLDGIPRRKQKSLPAALRSVGKHGKSGKNGRPGPVGEAAREGLARPLQLLLAAEPPIFQIASTTSVSAARGLEGS